MAFRYSVEVRNAGLDARIKAVGPNPTLQIFSSAQSVGRDPAGLLVSIPLGAKWMEDAEDGSVSFSGEWKGRATAGGKAKSFRIIGKDGICHIDGAIPDDMKLERQHLAPGQDFAVESFTIRSANG